MPKLPPVSGAQVIKVLKKIGFQQISQKGSHIKMRRVASTITDTVTVPSHREIKKGTLRNGILKPINLSVEEFIRLLKK